MRARLYNLIGELFTVVADLAYMTYGLWIMVFTRVGRALRWSLRKLVNLHQPSSRTETTNRDST